MKFFLSVDLAHLQDEDGTNLKTKQLKVDPEAH